MQLRLTRPFNNNIVQLSGIYGSGAWKYDSRAALRVRTSTEPKGNTNYHRLPQHDARGEIHVGRNEAEGTSSDLTSMATAGRVTLLGYRVTEDAIHFASGLMSNKEEAVPLWAVRDIDLNQGMTQRARGVGDLTLKLDHQAAANYGQRILMLKSIRDPKLVRTIILDQANLVRQNWIERQHNRDLEQRRAGAMTIGSIDRHAPQAQPVTSGDDFMTKLSRLGEMKQAGLLSNVEYAQAKAKLLS